MHCWANGPAPNMTVICSSACTRWGPRPGRRRTRAAVLAPPTPAERPYVYINMVASVDGKITVEGSERGLGSDADKRLFHELRAHADAVLDGATTARISGASPRVRDADLVAWRRGRGLPPHPLG